MTVYRHDKKVKKDEQRQKEAQTQTVFGKKRFAHQVISGPWLLRKICFAQQIQHPIASLAEPVMNDKPLSHVESTEIRHVEHSCSTL